MGKQLQNSMNKLAIFGGPKVRSKPFPFPPFPILGKEEEHKKTKEALDSALGFIRRLIAQRINLRFAPEIVFKEDRSGEYSVRIEEVLNELKEQNEPRKSHRLPKKA